MDARLNLKWELYGTEGLGSNPPIAMYECELGADQNGNIWMCRTQYRHQENKFLVMFDYSTDEQSAFLKKEVVYSDNYWKAHREIYHSRFVKYEDIQAVIREFIKEHGLPVKDVTGKVVS